MELLKRIDWSKLKKQKLILGNTIQAWRESEDPQQKSDAYTVEGLVNLVDAIQDAAVESKVATEVEVFGKEFTEESK